LSKRRIEKAKGNETGYNISNPKTSFLVMNPHSITYIHTFIPGERSEKQSKAKQNKTKPKEIKNKNKKKK
jgi:hypothetical protein